ncbi:DUF2203 family protein [Persicimonas caeni]|uniref:DUF2203 family protein n=1 Tax=Persicimonas caeni TaxID=2292766 RepID=A0A4Y6PRQ6_PERCE|nr:DUF2203 domain-containing protein [Persicimonas caeni]QDG51008.1 DUF2203 family protein [Persicimonas caeni]QED32229.1 DUF2203 family protein [Persicimonas caeni]
MQKRYFTVAEANEMIPFLESAFTRIIQMRHQIGDIMQLLQLVDAAPERDDFEVELPDASPAVIHNRATLKALMLAVQDELTKIEATGCLVKNLENGLVDWYATKGGRDVFLCWHVGEKEVLFWHDTREGFRGRRPIDELYELDETSEAEENAQAS